MRAQRRNAAAQIMQILPNLRNICAAPLRRRVRNDKIKLHSHNVLNVRKICAISAMRRKNATYHYPFGVTVKRDGQK